MTKQIPLTPLSQGKFAVVSDHWFEYLNQWKWKIHKGTRTWYATRSVGKSSISMHRQIMNPPKGMEVDHIDGNGLNNTDENLRICTHKENQRNVSIHRDSTEKYKCVRYRKEKNKYQAFIGFDGKFLHLGYFKTAEEAARAYDVAAVKYFGEFANLNFKGGNHA